MLGCVAPMVERDVPSDKLELEDTPKVMYRLESLITLHSKYLGPGSLLV